MDLKKLITSDPDVLGGQIVFSGTRVPVETLFDHLEDGISLETFLADFPSVSREQAVTTLEIANRLFQPGNISRLYEIAA